MQIAKIGYKTARSHIFHLNEYLSDIDTLMYVCMYVCMTHSTCCSICVLQRYRSCSATVQLLITPAILHVIISGPFSNSAGQLALIVAPSAHLSGMTAYE